MEDDNEALVIDIGTAHLKAGFCQEDAPKHMIPMVLGKPKNAGVLVDNGAERSRACALRGGGCSLAHALHACMRGACMRGHR